MKHKIPEWQIKAKSMRMAHDIERHYYVCGAKFLSFDSLFSLYLIGEYNQITLDQLKAEIIRELSVFNVIKSLEPFVLRKKWF